MHDRVRIVDNMELGHQQVTVNYPLRLRFELTNAALDALSESRRVRDTNESEDMLAPLLSLTGSVWPDEQTALGDIERAVRAGGHSWPTDPAFQNAVIGDQRILTRKEQPTTTRVPLLRSQPAPLRPRSAQHRP